MHCFAHIPTELQSKLGVKSCECLFMGYPPGGRRYRVCDCKSNQFFTSGNVIFDENIPHHSVHIVPSHSISYSSLPLSSLDQLLDYDHPSPLTSPAATPCESSPLSTPTHSSTSPPNIPSTPAHPAVIRPVHTRNLTEGGKEYTKQLAAAKAHLDKVQNLAASHRDHEIITENDDNDDNPFSLVCELETSPQLSSVSDSAHLTTASLDVKHYLERDREAFISDAAFLSICSDTCWEPSAAAYDMTIPPSTYKEAMDHSNCEA